MPVEQLQNIEDWRSWAIVALVSILGMIVGAIFKRGWPPGKGENGLMQTLRGLADTLLSHQKSLQDLMTKAIVSEQHQLAAKEARREAIKIVREDIGNLRHLVEVLLEEVRRK